MSALFSRLLPDFSQRLSGRSWALVAFPAVVSILFYWWIGGFIAFTSGDRSAKSEAKDFTNALGMELVWCEPGAFIMGSPYSRRPRWDKERPHRVRLTQGYWIGRYEVSQELWERLQEEDPSEGNSGPEFPVTNVRWEQAMEFCLKLTEHERSTGRLPEGFEYTLPTEAQWEYACRAGTRTPFSFGEVFDGSQANMSGVFGIEVEDENAYKKDGTTPVGSYPPNPWGIHDMHGNAMEWCRDWYWRYPLVPMWPRTDPEGPSRQMSGWKVKFGKVVRGGSYRYPTPTSRSAWRGSHSTPETGLRVALVRSKEPLK